MSSRYEESILRSLRRMTRAVDIHSKRLAKQHELTGPQLVCLREILKHVVATPTAIAKAISLSQGTVTGILDRLERRQLITRERSSEDKRRVLVRITARGEDLVAHAPSPIHEQFSHRLAQLPEGEQAMIDFVMGRVVHLLEAGTVDAAPMLMTGPAGADPEDVTRLFQGPLGDGSSDDE